MSPDYGASTKGMAINTSKFPMNNYTNPKTSGEIQDELRESTVPIPAASDANSPQS